MPYRVHTASYCLFKCAWMYASTWTGCGLGHTTLPSSQQTYQTCSSSPLSRSNGDVHIRRWPCLGRPSNITPSSSHLRTTEVGFAYNFVTMAFVTDILVGAITKGVNAPTWVVLNVICGLAFTSLLFLLGTSYFYSPALVPHVWVLLILAIGLWVSINWYIQQVMFCSMLNQRSKQAQHAAPCSQH